MNPEAVRKFISHLPHALNENDALAAAKQPEQENVERLRRLYGSLLDADAGIATLFADDVELEITGPAGAAMVGKWKGRDQVLAAAAQNFALIEDQKPEILSLVAQGDQVAVVARERGQVKATGAHYDIRWLQLFTFHGGKIVRVLQFCDNVNAFAS